MGFAGRGRGYFSIWSNMGRVLRTVTQSAASGAKFIISGNTMTMISSVAQTKTDNSGGVIITITDQAVATTTLQKQ